MKTFKIEIDELTMQGDYLCSFDAWEAAVTRFPGAARVVVSLL